MVAATCNGFTRLHNGHAAKGAERLSYSRPKMDRFMSLPPDYLCRHRERSRQVIGTARRALADAGQPRRSGEEHDEFHDDHWPIGFDKNGVPSVVGYIPDWEEFCRTPKIRPVKKQVANEPTEAKENGPRE